MCCQVINFPFLGFPLAPSSIISHGLSPRICHFGFEYSFSWHLIVYLLDKVINSATGLDGKSSGIRQLVYAYLWEAMTIKGLFIVFSLCGNNELILFNEKCCRISTLGRGWWQWCREERSCWSISGRRTGSPTALFSLDLALGTTQITRIRRPGTGAINEKESHNFLFYFWKNAFYLFLGEK